MIANESNTINLCLVTLLLWEDKCLCLHVAVYTQIFFYYENAKSSKKYMFIETKSCILYESNAPIVSNFYFRFSSKWVTKILFY